MTDRFGESRGQGPGLTWAERSEQWRRFAAWEAERLRVTPPDFQRALRWLADAWSLAARYDPAWGSQERAEEHWRHLSRVRAALARMRVRP